MVEKNPWWKNVSGPFPSWQGPVGVKEDGGGCHRAKGWVGKMQIHRAVNNRDKDGGLRIPCGFLAPHARLMLKGLLCEISCNCSLVCTS